MTTSSTREITNRFLAAISTDAMRLRLDEEARGMDEALGRANYWDARKVEQQSSCER